MFDWLCSSTIYGLFIALLPLAYIFRKAIMVPKKNKTLKRQSELKAVLPPKTNEKRTKPCVLFDAEQLQLMSGAVDLITFRLSLIESSIYKDLNPKPHLTTEEYIAAAQQMRNVVRQLKRMPKQISMPTQLEGICGSVQYMDKNAETKTAA